MKPGEKVEAVEDAVLKEIQRLQMEPPANSNSNAQKPNRSRPHFRTGFQTSARPCCWEKRKRSGLDGVKVSQFVERTRAVTPQGRPACCLQYLAADMRTTGTLIPLPPQKLNRRRRPNRTSEHIDDATTGSAFTPDDIGH